MSSIKLKHSGGNSVSLNPPTSAPTSSEVAFKLPNADGSADTFLKTDGSGTLSFAEAGGGKVLQIQSTVKDDTTSASSENTWEDISGMSVSITPASASNKILVLATVNVAVSNGTYYALRLEKASSVIFAGASPGNRSAGFAGKYDTGSNYVIHTDNMSFLDTAGGTSAITYKIAWYNPYGSSTRYLNRTPDDSNNDYRFRTASSITVMEIST